MNKLFLTLATLLAFQLISCSQSVEDTKKTETIKKKVTQKVADTAQEASVSLVKILDC